MEAFAYTARYDAAISRWFAEREEDFPAQYTRSFEKVLDLPYGENPHQRAAYYAEAGARTHLLSMVSKLHGKELSFNNLLDLDSARRLVEEFEVPAAAIIKHNNPCGAAVGASVGGGVRQGAGHRPSERLRRGDLLQPAGRPGAGREAERDVRGAGVRARATRTTRSRCSSRRRTCASSTNQERRRPPVTEHDIKRVRGGLLVQDRDARPRAARGDERGHRAQADRGGVGRAAVRDAGVQARALERDRARPRAWRRSGIGAGQMSRVDSVRIAVDKAARRRASLEGAALASDAFFPFADGPSWRSTRACGRSSSRAGRSATTRWSTPATRPASRWSSRPGATSATSA